MQGALRPPAAPLPPARAAGAGTNALIPSPSNALLVSYLFKNPGRRPVPVARKLMRERDEVSRRRPKFVRPESWRYVRLETTWRKPKGIDNHQRKQKSRGRPGLVKVGYGGARATKGLHPSGYTDNLVHNVAGLDGLDPARDGVRIAHGVGRRKRIQIAGEAISRKFRVFNARVMPVGS